MVYKQQQQPGFDPKTLGSIMDSRLIRVVYMYIYHIYSFQLFYPLSYPNSYSLSPP